MNQDDQAQIDTAIEGTEEPMDELSAIRTFVPESMVKAWQHNTPEEQIAGLKEFLRDQGKYWSWNGKTGEIKEKGKGGAEKGSQIHIPTAVIRAELELQITKLVQQYPDQESFITSKWLEVDRLIDQSKTKEGNYLLPNAPGPIRNHFQKKIVNILTKEKRKGDGKKKGKKSFDGYSFDDKE